MSNALVTYAQKKVTEANDELKNAIEAAGVAAIWGEDYARSEETARLFDRLRSAYMALKDANEMVVVAGEVPAVCKGCSAAGVECNPHRLHVNL